MFLVSKAEVILGGDYRVFGTSASEKVGYLDGDMVLAPSLNRGGDTLDFDAVVSTFSARLSGSSVVLTSPDGEIAIPVGAMGMILNFDGDRRVLRYSSEVSSVVIDDQIITSSNAVIA